LVQHTHDESVSGDEVWDGARLRLAGVGGSMLVCTREGTVVGATPSASALLDRLGVPAGTTRRLPTTLWSSVGAAPEGEARAWRPDESPESACLGCTRYALGPTHDLLLMREVTDKQVALSRRLHQQRLQAIGRLVATMAHDLRAPLSVIVFHSEVLSKRTATLSADDVRERAEEIRLAAHGLQSSIDGVLDYARLGPPITQPIHVDSIVRRVAALLRHTIRDGGHRLSIPSNARPTPVMANPIVVEQILVNLVLNALESDPAPREVSIDITSRDGLCCVVVEDDGPGIADSLRETVFEPFFTTKTQGTGIGLTSAREAARELGGDLSLEPSGSGARFCLWLPPAPRDSVP